MCGRDVCVDEEEKTHMTEEDGKLVHAMKACHVLFFETKLTRMCVYIYIYIYMFMCVYVSVCRSPPPPP